MNKLIHVLCIFCITSCSRSNQKPHNDLGEISFQMGYDLWNEKIKYVKYFGIPYDIKAFINGILAAEKGEKPLFSEEELTNLLNKFREELTAKQIVNNLKEAEDFLAQIATNPNVVEIVPSKLYYKILKKGNGGPVDWNEMPQIIFTAKSLVQGIEETIFSREVPFPISTADTLPGFSQGIVGMLKNERRILYIHPDLAYGTFGGKLEPNKLIILEVETIGDGQAVQSSAII